MKIKEGVSLEVLLNYGFEKIDKEEELHNDQYIIADYDLKFNIGHARRGQFYYLLVKESERTLVIHATDPDGSGGSVKCPDVLIKLCLEGLIEIETP